MTGGWWLVAGAAALLLAQEPAIRVNTRLVQLNVLVHDKNGPVADLTQDDFTVLDKGKPRAIALFSVHKIGDAGARPDSLPPGVFSNRLDVRSDTPSSVTVLLIDTLNTAILDQSYARSQAVKFLSALKRGDRVALYLLSGKGVRVLHDFTQDASALVEALAGYQGDPSSALQASQEQAPANIPAGGGMGSVIAVLNALIQQSYAEMRADFTAQRGLATLRALLAIAQHLERLPGRKNLVWVSGSFPFAIGIQTGRQPVFEHETKRVQQAMSKADVAIYPVDARGLIFRDRGTPPGFDTMLELASMTGGRAFIETNDLEGALRKVIDDSMITYTLGFYADDEKLDGSFHELKVNVDRKSVEVRHRKGYFALEEKAPPERELVALARNAASAPLDATGVGLTASIEPSDRSLRINLNVDVNNIALENKNGRWTGAADVTYVRQAADGRTLGVKVRTVNFNITDAVYRDKLRDGLALSETIESTPGMAQIRVVVVDQTTGVLGSLSVPVPKK